jgi:phenylacetic acid degradation protein
MDLTARCLTTMQEVEPLAENTAERLTHTHFNSDHVIKSQAS